MIKPRFCIRRGGGWDPRRCRLGGGLPRNRRPGAALRDGARGSGAGACDFRLRVTGRLLFRLLPWVPISAVVHVSSSRRIKPCLRFSLTRLSDNLHFAAFMRARCARPGSKNSTRGCRSSSSRMVRNLSERALLFPVLRRWYCHRRIRT